MLLKYHFLCFDFLANLSECNAPVLNCYFTPFLLWLSIQYSVTSLKTIPELCRRCDSQSEDRSGRFTPHLSSLSCLFGCGGLLEAVSPHTAPAFCFVFLLRLLHSPPTLNKQMFGHPLKANRTGRPYWGLSCIQINVDEHLNSPKPQYTQQFTENPEKPLVTKHNDAGANEKMLDAFTTHMARTSLGDGALPKSETLSGMRHDRICNKAYCNS